MAMRYHWGLGIGHTYSHGRNVPSQQYSESSASVTPTHESEDFEASPDLSSSTQANPIIPSEDDDSDATEPPDSEAEDPGTDYNDAVYDSDAPEASDVDDDELLEIHDTYHSD